MEIPRERRMREVVNDTSPPVDFGNAEAGKMYQRQLQEREKALGADHTLTLDTVRSLGLFYTNQGMLAEAEEMYQRALQEYETALGHDHAQCRRVRAVIENINYSICLLPW
jgi:tetratricopeptide (TPR) repeat protein